jgi:hypothetical protein
MELSKMVGQRQQRAVLHCLLVTVSTEGFRMRSVLTTILASVATLLVLAAGSKAAPEKSDLTGRWVCDDGGTYFVRQVGDEVWWTGKSGEPKRR